MMKLEKGKRYVWRINDYEDKTKDGLFTGEFDANGNAILMTRSGEEWSVPAEELRKA